MNYRRTTQVPNSLFDVHLPSLTLSELKIFLVVIRQTNGWIDKRTGKRKVSDRISHSQFMRKTGLSRRVISSTVSSLISRGLIEVKSAKGDVMANSKERCGKRLWYGLKQSELCCKLHIASLLTKFNYRSGK